MSKKTEVKKSVSMQIEEVRAEVLALTEAVKHLITIKDGRHEAVIARLKDISDKI